MKRVAETTRFDHQPYIDGCHNSLFTAIDADRQMPQILTMPDGPWAKNFSQQRSFLTDKLIAANGQGASAETEIDFDC